MPQFLRGHCQSLVKPIRQTFESEGSRTDKYFVRHIKWNIEAPDKLALFTVHKYYFDFEKLNAALVDPARFPKDESRFFLQACPPNPSYYKGLESSLLDLASMMRQEIASQLHPLKWPGQTDLIEFVEASMHRVWSSQDWEQSSIGIAQIQEGHARLLEMQLVASQHADKEDFDFFRASGYLGKRYTTAYAAFLEWSGLNPPSTVLDWRVHVFVLVCEYALNPTAPYLDGFERDGLFDQFHPAARFRKACLALAELPSLAPSGRIGPEFMRAAFDAIEEATKPKWALTLNEALHRVEAFAMEFFNADIAVDQPFFNLTARHLSTVLLRAQNPSMYLTPLDLVLDGPGTVPFLLPPAIRFQSHIVFPEIPFGTERPSWPGYLIGLVYCDLIDQLLRCRGPFTYDCKLIPAELSSAIVKSAEDAFASYFGVPITAVRTTD